MIHRRQDFRRTTAREGNSSYNEDPARGGALNVFFRTLNAFFGDPLAPTLKMRFLPRDSRLDCRLGAREKLFFSIFTF